MALVVLLLCLLTDYRLLLLTASRKVHRSTGDGPRTRSAELTSAVSSKVGVSGHKCVDVGEICMSPARST